jgi:hypothetical protein
MLPGYRMNFTVVGDLGVKAHNLDERLHKYMDIKPHVVLVNLDSDLSNVNEDVMSSEEKQQTRDFYRANMTAVCQAWLDHGALVALGGPGLLGEGLLRPRNIERFRNKDGMLDAYAQINQEVALSLNIPFFDLRKKLKDAIPWYRLYYNGYVTRDGEVRFDHLRYEFIEQLGY